MLLNNTTSQATAPFSTLWTSTDIFSLINLVAILLTNGTTLFVYARCSQLRSNTFSLYLINLLISNVFKALTAPVEIIQHLAVRKDQSAAYCATLIALGYTSNAVMMHNHVLITMNRVWAITFPVGYRNYHSRRTAVVLCVAMWVYVFVWLLPGIIVDGVWYHVATGSNCMLNNAIPAQRNWNMAAQVIVYTLPIFVVILAYPLIWYKRQRQRRLRPTESIISQKEPTSLPSDKDERRQHSHSFKVLTLLTISVLVCWTPLTVYYDLLVFGEVDVGGLYEGGWVLWEIEPVFDPLLFAVALKTLREELKRLLCW
ncbi:mu-type opioid receptor-like [Paramacrobiotus metropolitanus]|uniref:mu-type opioid receptor-like n=1 Tax=Paramacrobiotus metropolitanus TaxID=2943436 RepID=UPI0024459F68|nr:mu-type opioid receptor-like [Paramacrobiotus metropolitanus]